MVDLNGVQSKPLIKSRGVPQGSILGPLLFILFINDFPINNYKFDTLFYANDILISFPITNENYEQINNDINNESNSINNWFKNNYHMVNINKTYYTVFKNINTNFNINNLNFVIDNNLITYKITFKYLDIIFDNNLILKHHIGYLVNKLYKITSKIYFLKKTYKLNTKTLLNLYHSLFYPHINYCNTVWACNYKSNIKNSKTKKLDNQNYL